VTLNGTIAVLAGITPAAGFINPEWALLIGLTLGIVSYFGGIILKEKLKVDDALDVAVVHGLTGIIGSIATGCFASREINPLGQSGAIDGHPFQIVYQIMGVAIAIIWSGTWTLILLHVIDITIGIRVSDDVERRGLGFSEHNEYLDGHDYQRRKKFTIQL